MFWKVKHCTYRAPTNGCLLATNKITGNTVDEIHELFRLRSNKYLRDTCGVEMPMRNQNQSKEFYFITGT